MKTFLAILLLTTLGLKAEMEFSGFFTTSQEALFILTDTETKHSSGWLKLGQSFGGYRLVSFEKEKDILTLEQGERSLQLPLRTSKVKEGRTTISGTLRFQNEKIEGVRATLVLGEEASFPLKNGVAFRIRAEQRPDGNILYRTKFVTTDEDGTERVHSAPAVITLPGKPFGIQNGDFGYFFTP